MATEPSDNQDPQQEVINPAPQVVEQKRQELQQGQAGQNFVGSNISEDESTKKSKRFLNQLGSSVGYAFIGLVALFIVSTLINIPSPIVFLGIVAFTCFVLWKSFLALQKL